MPGKTYSQKVEYPFKVTMVSVMIKYYLNITYYMD